jgi:hypothetical protein
VANPFVQGILRGKELSLVAETECAQSGMPMRIGLDSALNVIEVDEGSDPMISVPLVNLVELKEPCIVDVF